VGGARDGLPEKNSIHQRERNLIRTRKEKPIGPVLLYEREQILAGVLELQGGKSYSWLSISHAQLVGDSGGAKLYNLFW